MDEYEEPTCGSCGAPFLPEGWIPVAVPVHATRPDLSPWDAQTLRAAPELRDCAGDNVEYGESLHESFERCDGFLNDFLIRASLAGHAPTDTEGICAALLALDARNVADATDYVAQGVDADALGALDAFAFRKVTALLERLAADLAHRAADIHQSPRAPDITPKIHALRLQQAEKAEQRAMNALKRGLEVEKDSHDAGAERDWHR